MKAAERSSLPGVDIGYLRAHPQHVAAFLHHQRIRTTPVAGGDICAAERLTLDDGTDVFYKCWPEHPPGPATAPAGFFTSEAAELQWLREADAVPIPEVLGVSEEALLLEWIDSGDPSREAAEQLGRDLAAMHRAGAPDFGAVWPGFIGWLPLDNTPTESAWPQWYAERRLTPYLRMSVDRGGLSAADVALVEKVIVRIDRLAGPAEPPARLHGDLWPGNLLWASDGRAWLVDPAAHGGHRETDLALLRLFGGAPYLDRVLAAYDEAWPLADGWRERVPLHQLYLLLVHTAMFGGVYREAVRHAATALT